MSGTRTRQWRPDILGDGWEQLTITVGHDTDGPVVATLVRATAETVRRVHGGTPDRAVLYVHGFNDYFFQTHHAEEWLARGYDFHAVDLRHCGRSLRPGRMAHYWTDLRQPASDLTAALRLVRAGRDGVPPERVVVLAHSTGGLVASLWVHTLRRAGVVDALVLNSPWFELNAPWLGRMLGSRLVATVGPRHPSRVLWHGPSAYSRQMHVEHGGRWTYDRTLKSPESLPVRAGWLHAIRRGQARLARGLAIDVPVLVCTAAASGPNWLRNPHLDRQDTVLDVRHMADRARLLGPDVTVVTIPDAVHDLSLSSDVPRQTFVDTVFGWLERVLPRT